MVINKSQDQYTEQCSHTDPTSKDDSKNGMDMFYWDDDDDVNNYVNDNVDNNIDDKCEEKPLEDVHSKSFLEILKPNIVNEPVLNFEDAFNDEFMNFKSTHHLLNHIYQLFQLPKNKIKMII